MNTRGRVAAFLREHQTEDVCDACIAASLGISVEDAAQAAAELGRQKAFLRDRWPWPCRLCRRTGIVTRALPGAMSAPDERRPGSAA